MKIFKNVLFGCFIALCFFRVAHSTYPDQPIKIIVPFPPGGTTDVLGRI